MLYDEIDAADDDYSSRPCFSRLQASAVGIKKEGCKTATAMDWLGNSFADWLVEQPKPMGLAELTSSSIRHGSVRRSLSYAEDSRSSRPNASGLRASGFDLDPESDEKHADVAVCVGRL